MWSDGSVEGHDGDFLADALIGLGLRRAGGGLCKRAHDGLTGEPNLEVVVAVAFGIGQNTISGRANLSVFASWPRRRSSATVSRQGLWATPPSTSRAVSIRSPSSRRAAARETSAKA